MNDWPTKEQIDAVGGIVAAKSVMEVVARIDKTCREHVEHYKARAEAAEADARRYRWLRDSAEDASHFAPLVFMCDPERQLRWGDALTAGSLDAAIDAELAKEPKP